MKSRDGTRVEAWLEEGGWVQETRKKARHARRRALFGVERERGNVGDARVTRPDALPFSPLFVASPLVVESGGGRHFCEDRTKEENRGWGVADEIAMIGAPSKFS